MQQHDHGPSSTVAFRKFVLIGLLAGAMVLLHQFAEPTGAIDPRAMLALGFVVLACFAIGELVELVKLPHITGYLLAGLALGPSTAHILGGWWDLGNLSEGVLNPQIIEQLHLFESLALALIALTAGGELKLEGLRRGLRAILGVFTGQLVALLAAFTVFVVLLGHLPWAPPELATLGTGEALALGAALGAIALATSPAATIAVITGSGARGPLTRAVLSTVVLKDVAVVVLFSVFSTLALTLGGSSVEGGLLQEILVHVVGSLVAGVAAGMLIDLYLRYVKAEVLLFILALVFTTIFLAGRLHLDPVLLFIAAGFTASNFSQEGDTLIHTVERLSTPVYVVFFTLVGAGLHLDSLVSVAGLAAVLIGVRTVAVWVGSTVGARVAKAPPVVRRYGWLGFMSQAGITIGLAGLVGERFGEAGVTLETLIIAGVAVHELAGPILLKLGLGLGRELPLPSQPHTEAVAHDTPTDDLSEWPLPERSRDPWGPPLQSQSHLLDAPVAELQADLQSLVRDLLQGPLGSFQANADTYLRALRREFLKHQRATLRRLAEGGDAVGAQLLRDEARLAERWRALVLDRAARHALRGWHLERLVQALDRITDTVPEVVLVPYEPASLHHPEAEPLPRTLLRLLLRARVRLSRLGRGSPERRVRLQQIVRYHLFGRGPQQLEGLAALIATGEEHLLQRTRSLFDGVVEGYDQAAALADTDADASREVLGRLRRSVDQEFELATEEVDRMTREGAVRTAHILGDLAQAIKADALVAGTPDLLHTQRRISRVFRAHTAGLDILTRGMSEARRTAAARWSGLSLELELVGLEGRIKDQVEEHAQYLGRMVHGRAYKQVLRVQASLAEVLGSLTRALADASTGTDTARVVRRETEPLEHLVGDAARTARLLQQQLSADAATSTLLDALLHETHDLTERYVVPIGPSLRGEWKLPPPVPTAELAFREVVIAYVETSVTRDLLQLTRQFSGRVEELITDLEELERLVAFNAELAGAELDVLEAEEVPESTLEIVREMVIGSLQRARGRVDDLVLTCKPWQAELRAGIRTAVLEDLQELRVQAIEGRVSELRTRLREAATGRRMTRDAEHLSGTVARASHQLAESLRSTLGEERIARLRRRLGLPQPPPHTRFGPGAFDAPPPAVTLQVVYRRLFSDQALEAGDLFVGRQDELSRARAVLASSRPGALRTTAVIGLRGVGKGAVIQALVRSLDATRVDRIDLRGPVTDEEVDAWFSGPDGRIVVVDGFEWLFDGQPCGHDPLRRFVEGVVADHGRSRWVVEAEAHSWHLATRMAPVGDAFPEVVEIRPLNTEELADAILARHAMSGYRLHFEAEADIGWQVRHLLTRANSREDRRQQAWFATLHAATGGIIHDALQLWMTSVRRVDDEAGSVHIGPVPQPPLAALASLPEDVLLTLRQTLRQGWMTPDQHAVVFRTDHATAVSHLARLAHWGLMEEHEGFYFLSGHLAGAVHRVLRRRGWA